VTVVDGDLQALEARTLALLSSDAVTEPTRRALATRLDRTFGPPRVLSESQMRTLEAVCLRLIPEPELVARTALAAALEARLAEATPRGWRYAEAPADLALHRAGLDALEVLARADQGRSFPELPTADQDGLLQRACAGELTGEAPLDRWFEELLSALTELYYAHPLVQVSIGYDGMADAHGVAAVSPAAIAQEAERLGR
jgi:hypothetical protein